MTKKTTKRALVLSGGGAKGAYQAGAISGLLQRRREMGDHHGWDAFIGVSVGAINAAWMAQGADAHHLSNELLEMWKNLQQKDVSKRSFLGPLALLWQPALEDTGPLRQFIHDRLGRPKKDLRVLAVDAMTGRTRTWTESDSADDLLNGIMASSAAPLLYPPVKLPTVKCLGEGGEPEHDFGVYVDGGVADVTPLGAAIATGADVIDVVLVESKKLSPWSPEPDRVWNTGPRALELMFHTIVEDDLKICALTNRLVAAGVTAAKREIKVNLIRPDEPLDIDSAKFEPERMKAAISLGLQAPHLISPFH